jgi:hypothetical protein
MSVWILYFIFLVGTKKLVALHIRYIGYQILMSSVSSFKVVTDWQAYIISFIKIEKYKLGTYNLVTSARNIFRISRETAPLAV